MFITWLKDDSGQAIVEFVLLAGISILIVATLKDTIKSVTVKIWSLLAKRIAAPCPRVRDCDPGDAFEL